MWYVDLTYVLIGKIKTKEQKYAEDFIHIFFTILNNQIINPEQDFDESQLNFRLLLLEKLYKKFANKVNASVSLREFSRYFLGLVLVCSKVGNDCIDLLNRDFLPLFQNKILIDAWDIQQELDDLTAQLQQGTKVFSYSIKDIVERAYDEERDGLSQAKWEQLIFHSYQNFKPFSNYIESKLLIMKQLEKEVLTDLNFDLTINNSFVYKIFKAVTPPIFVEDFLKNAVDSLGLDSSFDTLVSDIYKIPEPKLDQENSPQDDLNLAKEINQFCLQIREKYFFDENLDKFCFKLKIHTRYYLNRRETASYYDLKKVVFAHFPALSEELKKAFSLVQFSVLVTGLCYQQVNDDPWSLSLADINFIKQLSRYEPNQTADLIVAYLDFLQKNNDTYLTMEDATQRLKEWKFEPLKFALQGFAPLSNNVPLSEVEQKCCRAINQIYSHSNKIQDDNIFAISQLLVAVIQIGMNIYLHDKTEKNAYFFKKNCSEVIKEYQETLKVETQFMREVSLFQGYLKKFGSSRMTLFYQAPTSNPKKNSASSVKEHYEKKAPTNPCSRPNSTIKP